MTVVSALSAVVVRAESRLAAVGVRLSDVHVAVGVSLHALELAALPISASVLCIGKSGRCPEAPGGIAHVPACSAVVVGVPQVHAGVLPWKVGLAVRIGGGTAARYFLIGWRLSDARRVFGALVSARAAMVIASQVGFTSVVDDPVAVFALSVALQDATAFDAVEALGRCPHGTRRTACAAVLRIGPEVHIAKELRAQTSGPPLRTLVGRAVVRERPRRHVRRRVRRRFEGRGRGGRVFGADIHVRGATRGAHAEEAEGDGAAGDDGYLSSKHHGFSVNAARRLRWADRGKAERNASARRAASRRRPRRASASIAMTSRSCARIPRG